MFKRNSFLVIMMVLLAAGIAGSLWFYNTYIVPNARMSSTYMEVYQDLDANEIKTISIDTINHRVNVVPTDDEKVKISYFQRTDSANSFVINNRDVSLKIIERAEAPTNSFISSTRQIDTITIYLPSTSSIAVTNKTIEGVFNAENVTAESFVLSSISGAVNFKNVKVGKLDINSNSGVVEIEGMEADLINILEVTGNVSLEIKDSLTLYNLNIISNNGRLNINESPVKVVIDDKETVVNHIEEVREGVTRSISINSLRSSIDVISNEEAVPETNENVQE
ncbi:MAG: DUF4097 family beta strand repeat protein [Erysipelotrichaceae bacterium]|nr:DUF4097 family beta strand repeat protein [Erysipelotrichaceae bacterium]MBQ1522644.1 DUF4097 family beta strand repeat protein [Erysipelotrichaceae bacterium]